MPMNFIVWREYNGVHQNTNSHSELLNSLARDANCQIELRIERMNWFLQWEIVWCEVIELEKIREKV